MKTRFRIHRRLFRPDLVVLQVGIDRPIYRNGGPFNMPPRAPGRPIPPSAIIRHDTHWRDATPDEMLVEQCCS